MRTHLEHLGKARLDLKNMEAYSLSHDHLQVGRLRFKEGGEEARTPNVPKLLFPASFTRVGALTVDPMVFPTPWRI
jgi:hypothetical protein